MLPSSVPLSISWVLSFSLAMVLLPAVAQAYIGPGTGLSALGAILAVVGTVCFSLVGLVWYPVKRFINFIRAGWARRTILR